MAKLYDVVAVVGEYTAADGSTKKRYANLGAIIEGKNGPALKLETIPLGWNGWAYLNEPKPKEQAPSKFSRGNQASADEPNDDIPF